MAKTAKIDVENGDLLSSLREFFRTVLELPDISAILVPQKLPMKNMIMPTLVTDPAQLEGTDPLAPVFPMNAAKLVSKLTRKPFGGKLAVVMRPCEIRAFIELVKLKQGRMDEVVILGVDCMGAYKNSDYFRFVEENESGSTRRFFESILLGKETVLEEIDLAPACKACEYPVPENADMLIELFGIDTSQMIMVQARSTIGEELFDRLDLAETDEPPERASAVKSILGERTAYRDRMFEETREATDTLEKLTTYLANCINCYNCRVACPVCYCKECVFATDVFNHEPSQYMQWAGRKGLIKMPTDTVFYHITRIAHMSTACIGCGQCSNACPNDIPVMELFRTASERTQKAFDYEAGKSIEDDPPLSVFREEELADIIGVGKA
jgi:formate dehydrogenase subunit beta